jgi:RimJ/RimL family protein N-acetyltransferase
MAHGWQGKLVRLVPLDAERHFDNALRWINDPEVTQWLKMGDTPMSRLAEKEWFDRVQMNGPNDVFFAIETLAGSHIGFSGIHKIDYRHGFGHTGSIIGESAEWGRGYGTDAAQIRARYAFEVLGLRMLMSGYLDGNEGSRKMQERAGYVEWGRVPDKLWKRGRYRDHVYTMLTRERWLELQAASPL